MRQRVWTIAVSAMAVAAVFVAMGSLYDSPVPSSISVVHAAAASPAMLHPDAVCRKCHEQIYDRYKKTPMAMGSGLALDGLDDMELHARNLMHDASAVTYRVTVRGGKAYLDYSRPAGDVRGPLEGERQLDYFIGSGRRGRTFLYQQEGLWFEAPINWYGKKKLWDMAPAYEGATVMPDPLPVDPNCLHCHTSDTQLSTGAARNHYAGAPFLAAGVGCAACHGDATAHLAGVAGGKPGTGPIVNPDSLDAVRRDSTCIQCHLEGDAAIYLPGKSLADFRPGDDLSKSVVYFIDRTKAQLGRRASSQYEALLRSACKRASGDKLTCTTCHDPHDSPAPAERVAYFRARCLGCHTGASMATHHPEQQNCASCHMPTRSTLDISHEQLTDHDIEANPKRSSRILTDLTRGSARDLVPVGGVTAGERELGLAYAELAQHGDRSSGEKALQLLKAAEAHGSNDADLHDRLGYLLQVSGDARGAASNYFASLKERPQDSTAAANLAVLDAGMGQSGEAVRLLTQVVKEDPSQTAAGLNLAFLECRMGRKEDAAATVRRMLEFNPDSVAARQMLKNGSYGGQSCSLR
jgi:predicted CXXCH cytochrome family protein